MTTLDADTKQSLLDALNAYVYQYGGGSVAEMRAIAGSLLTVQEKAGELVAEGLEIEEWVDELVESADLSELASKAWDEGAQAIATQAKHWRETLEVKAQATLDAYIQKYVPELDTVKIQDLVATVLPIVEDATISRDEAQRLIHKVSEDFDWTSAVERVIDPKWMLLADKTLQIVRHRDVENMSTEVMNAYVHKFQPTAVEIGEDLVEQAVQAVTNSKVKLGLDVDLDPETQRLMVKQVMLKFNLLEASPPPSKTALEIAQQVHEEVVRYRREQGLDRISYIPEVTRTDESSGSSVLGGPMGIGFELRPRFPQSEQDETPETD